MTVLIGPYVASLAGGTATGMMVGDMLGSVPQEANVPATSASAKPKVVSDGTPVPTTGPTARQSLWMSAAIVLAAMAILVFGAKKLDGIRIG